MMNGQITLTADSDELYERGRIVAHSSDESGMPDVGLSVGLGCGWMLFAGDTPGHDHWALSLYGQRESKVIASSIDGEAAQEMIERIAGAICKQATGED